jgi:hypothetical protein
LIHGTEDGLLRRGIHEIELEQIIYVKTLQQQNHVAQVRPLDFRDVILEELFSEDVGAIKTIAKTRASSTSSSSTLISICLRNRGNLKGVHTYLRVVDFQLAKSCIHNILYTIQGQRCLSNVCSHYTLS